MSIIEQAVARAREDAVSEKRRQRLSQDVDAEQSAHVDTPAHTATVELPNLAGAPVLDLPPWAISDAGAKDLAMPRVIQQQFRSVKRALISRLAASTSPYRNVVMVTSAVPGEGKTFCSVNLALSLASERDTTVTLIDTDVVRRTATRDFGAGDRRGLHEWIETENMPLESVLCRTAVDGLSFMPAGPPHANASELFASGRMDVALKRLGQCGMRHLFVLDSPPLLPTAEALALAGKIHHVLLVCRSGITPTFAFSQAMQKLEKVPDVSVLLNSYSPRKIDEYYDYADSYGQLA